MPKIVDRNFAVTLGARLRSARTRANRTQVDMGDELGVTYQMIQRYESGKARISVQQLDAWSRACNVAIVELVTDAAR